MTTADAQLVEDARGGSTDAVSALFARHWKDAWRLARAVAGSETAADDIAQEGFLRAMQGLGRLRNDQAFRPWLHRTIYRLALDELRSRRRVAPAPDAAFAAVPAEPEQGGLDEALRLLGGVTPDQRAAIVLRHCLGYSLEETAEVLGAPVGTIQSRVARGLAHLKVQLQEARDVR